MILLAYDILNLTAHVTTIAFSNLIELICSENDSICVLGLRRWNSVDCITSLLFLTPLTFRISLVFESQSVEAAKTECLGIGIKSSYTEKEIFSIKVANLLYQYSFQGAISAGSVWNCKGSWTRL